MDLRCACSVSYICQFHLLCLPVALCSCYSIARCSSIIIGCIRKDWACPALSSVHCIPHICISLYFGTCKFTLKRWICCKVTWSSNINGLVERDEDVLLPRFIPFRKRNFTFKIPQNFAVAYFYLVSLRSFLVLLMCY